jgi:hypothetical protein
VHACTWGYKIILPYVLNEIGDLEDCDKGHDSKEYDAAMKEFEAQLAREELEKNQATIKQVFMTSKGDDGSQAAANTPAPVAKDAHAT